MEYSAKFIKQAKEGNVGHIYEHVISNAIVDFAVSAGYLAGLDYTLKANTYDGIVVFHFSTKEKELYNNFVGILKSAIISTNTVEVACDQISAEYQRLYSININDLKNSILSLHSEAWYDYDDYTYSEPISSASRSLKSLNFSLEKVSAKDFVSIDFTYELIDCPHALKSLAVYVVQFLALSQIDMATNKIKIVYDAGDEWAEYQSLVGYVHTLRFNKKHQISTPDLKKIFKENMESVKTKGFVGKLVDFARNEVDYFDDNKSYANSYMIIGKKGWQEIATKENIERILKNLKVTVQEQNTVTS